MKTMQLKTNSGNQHLLEEFMNRYNTSGCKNAVDFIGQLMEGSGKVTVSADQQQTIASQQQTIADLTRQLVNHQQTIADLTKYLEAAKLFVDLQSADLSRPTEALADLGRPSTELVETIKAGFGGNLEYLANSESFTEDNHLTKEQFKQRYPELLDNETYSNAVIAGKGKGYLSPDASIWHNIGSGKGIKWYQR